MQCARRGENEGERLAALLAYDILDTGPEQAYDDLTRIAAQICGTPIALVSLVDQDRQWFKSAEGLDAQETPRDVAFCAHAILEPHEVFVVKDALEDERFFDNPLVTGAPVVRFYAGAPLVNSEGQAVGTLCVIDHEPRELSEEQVESLSSLARQVVSQLELRKNNLELRRAVQGLKNANEELESFAAFAAHDLRSPLNRIIAYSGFLKEQDTGRLSAESVRDLDYIAQSAKDMDGLIASMLALCGAGRGRIADSSVALSDCAQLAIDSLKGSIEEKQVQVCIDSLPFVRGDVTLLTQLFHNLIDNALKYHEDGAPHIHIGCQETDRGIAVFIQDNGSGMNPSQVAEAFTPFSRLRHQPGVSGSGIGLAIVKKVVERHGGEIALHTSPGNGCRFEFTLPGLRMPREPHQGGSDADFEFRPEELYG